MIKEGTAIRDLYPDYVEPGSVYEALAQAYIAKKDNAKAMEQLKRYAKIGGQESGYAEPTRRPRRGSRGQTRRRGDARKDQLYLPAGRESPPEAGRSGHGSGQPHRGDPRVSARCWRSSRWIPPGAHYQLAKAYAGGAQRTTKRGMKCCPRWKSRRATATRKSYYWN